MGLIEVVDDYDWFSISLPAGLWAFKTQAGGPVNMASDCYYLTGNRGYWESLGGGTIGPGFYLKERWLQVSEPATCKVRVNSPSGLPAVGQYTLRVDAAVDDHCDRRGNATPIQISEEVIGILELATDEDWFSISIEEGWWTFELRFPGWHLAGLELFSASAFRPSSRVAASGYDDSPALIGFLCLPGQAGNYYVRVSKSQVSSRWKYWLTNYTLAVTPGKGPSSPDDHGDSIENATRIQVFERVYGSIEATGDADYFAVFLTATHQDWHFIIYSPRVDITMTLYHRDGRVIKSATPDAYEDSSYDQEFNDEMLDMHYKVLRPATYYLGVQTYENRGPIDEYKLWIDLEE